MRFLEFFPRVLIHCPWWMSDTLHSISCLIYFFFFFFACLCLLAVGVLLTVLKPICSVFHLSFPLPSCGHLPAASQSKAQKKLQPVSQVPVLQEQGEYCAGFGGAWTWVYKCVCRGLRALIPAVLHASSSFMLAFGTACGWLLVPRHTFKSSPWDSRTNQNIEFSGLCVLWARSQMSAAHWCRDALILQCCALPSAIHLPAKSLDYHYSNLMLEAIFYMGTL